ncbi:MAG: GNAT family N-acetyltransferase, partial [Deltaproteobacteria bacterium]|nr:GNAT family N-acetyltransferase [Deltaproteobacteria bacterium]
AYYPATFTFNTFTNTAINDLSGLLRFCDDVDANPFLTFYSRHLLHKIDDEKPSLIGISISTSHQLAGALTLARLIKKNYPSMHVTLGGKHILRLQEFFVDDPAFFHEFCHSMILDNGERPLKRLVQALSEGRSLSHVANLAYFKGDRVVFNEKGPHEPISSLPAPDFSDLPLHDYFSPAPIIPLRLSEGCYWGKCTFCSRYDNKRFKTVDPERAVNQMQELQERYGVSCFTINDDCLTPTYLEALSRAIINKGLCLEISLWCKPVASFTKKRLRLLGKAGVRLIRWGLETGHPRILKRMNKGTRLADTLKVLKDASEAGIWNHATMIFGFPTETLQEAKETIRFLEENHDIIHSSIFFRFVLLSHSYIMEHPEEFSLQSLSRQKGLFSYDHEYTCSEGMEREAFSSFWDWALQYRIQGLYGHPFWFYLRIREYLLLYVARYGLEPVKSWKVKESDLSVYPLGEAIDYFFLKPEEVSPQVLEHICALVGSGGEVGLSWMRDNLRNAFAIGYAVEQGRMLGAMVHKRPLEKYVKQIEEKTGLDLEGYLERGYSYVRPEYRRLGLGDRLLKGLVHKSRGKKIYVTIRMDNVGAIKLTLKNHMKLAATYYNEKTGHEIGVFVNQ